MTNPVVDLIGDRTGRIVPVYPQSEKAGVMSWDLARFIDEVLERAGDFAEPLDVDLLDRLDLVDRTTAFHGIHGPESMREAAAARRRLAFDELLRVQLELVRRKRELERTAVGIAHDVGDGTGGHLVAALPRAPALRAHRRPAAHDRRDRRRPGQGPSDAPAAAGRRRCRARPSWR